jgi:hypothetical protein
MDNIIRPFDGVAYCRSSLGRWGLSRRLRCRFSPSLGSRQEELICRISWNGHDSFCGGAEPQYGSITKAIQTKESLLPRHRNLVPRYEDSFQTWLQQSSPSNPQSGRTGADRNGSTQTFTIPYSKRPQFYCEKRLCPVRIFAPWRTTQRNTLRDYR